jgi:hypothetical protein
VRFKGKLKDFVAFTGFFLVKFVAERALECFKVEHMGLKNSDKMA